MLKSLEKQTKPQDYLTIIIDAKDKNSVYEKVKNKTSRFNCNVNIIFEEKNLGYCGHGIRNKYQNLPGEFILHFDDDNCYTPNSILTMRKICQDKKNLYIFRMKNINAYIWKEPKIIVNNIGTPNGVIPSKLNNSAKWSLSSCGDGQFYVDLTNKIDPENIFFCRLYYL